MKVRDYLNSLTNQELVEYLDSEKEEINVQTSEEPDWSRWKNFTPSEFTCNCGKCQLSNEEYVRKNINPHLMDFLQFKRVYFGKPVKITGRFRCAEVNSKTTGSVANSGHLTLDAADSYIEGVTGTVSGREECVKLAKAFPYHNYSYHNKDGKYPNMGGAVHDQFSR